MEEKERTYGVGEPFHPIEFQSVVRIMSETRVWKKCIEKERVRSAGKKVAGRGCKGGGGIVGRGRDTIIIDDRVLQAINVGRVEPRPFIS